MHLQQAVEMCAKLNAQDNGRRYKVGRHRGRHRLRDSAFYVGVDRGHHPPTTVRERLL
jgi:hypothetical protein